MLARPETRQPARRGLSLPAIERLAAPPGAAYPGRVMPMFAQSMYAFVPVARLTSWAAASMLAVSIAGCSAQESEQVGEQAAAGERALKIASINPCVDAILLDVASRDQIAAISHYSHDLTASSIPLSRAREFPATGGTAEELIALGPDILLASTFTPPPLVDALEKAGIKVEVFGSALSLEESLAQIDRIADLAGQAAAGQALAARIADQPRPPAPRQPIKALIWQPGQIVAGQATLISEQLGWAGFTNQAALKGLDQADFVALEVVLADPPDLLLVAGSQIGQHHPALQALGGTRIEPLAMNLIFCGGPVIPRLRARLSSIRRKMEEAR